MSQNDFNLANQGFPAMRADMNSAFQALASNSSGATEPGTTYAYQWWYDETTDILKIRNADDDAWINIASFDQANDTWSPYVGATALTATGAEINLLDGAVDHATAAWETGTATEAGVPSPADVKAAIDALGGGADFSAVAEDIIPDADSTRDIGSTSTRWAQGWFDDVTSTNTSDGTLSIPTTYVTNGSAKAWVNFNGTGTIAARDSLNVSSLTDNGTGNYTVNFTSAFGAVDYTVVGSTSTLTALTRTTVLEIYDTGTPDLTVSSARVSTSETSSTVNRTPADRPVVSATFNGDLA